MEPSVLVDVVRPYGRLDDALFLGNSHFVPVDQSTGLLLRQPRCGRQLQLFRRERRLRRSHPQRVGAPSDGGRNPDYGDGDPPEKVGWHHTRPFQPDFSTMTTETELYIFSEKA